MTSNIVRRHLDGFLPLLSFLFDFELSMCVVSYLFLIHLISTSIHTTHSFNWRIHRIQKSRLIPAKICKIQTISTNNFKIGFINLYHCMAIATACDGSVCYVCVKFHTTHFEEHDFNFLETFFSRWFGCCTVCVPFVRCRCMMENVHLF